MALITTGVPQPPSSALMLMDEALLGDIADPSAGGAQGGRLAPEQSPQEQAAATYLTLTQASQSRAQTEAFYGMPSSLLDIQQMVDTMVNSMSASVTQYAASAEELSRDTIVGLLRP